MINQMGTGCGPARLVRCLTTAVLGIGMLAGCTSASTTPASSAPQSAPSNTPGTAVTADPAQAAAVDKVVQEAMKARHLRAAIVRVTVDGKEIITKA
jgi:hypothetical protein